MTNNKLFEFDNLTLYAKKHKVNEIINYYKSFGWKLIKQTANAHYEDIIDLDFERKHKIKDKDELQLLQVYLENNINKLGKIEQNKKSKIVTLSCLFYTGSIFIFLLGILSLINLININFFIGLSISLVGIILFCFNIILLPKLKIAQHQKSNEVVQHLKNEIQDICQQAQRLLGENTNDQQQN